MSEQPERPCKTTTNVVYCSFVRKCNLQFL